MDLPRTQVHTNPIHTYSRRPHVFAHKKSMCMIFGLLTKRGGELENVLYNICPRSTRRLTGPGILLAVCCALSHFSPACVWCMVQATVATHIDTNDEIGEYILAWEMDMCAQPFPLPSNHHSSNINSSITIIHDGNMSFIHSLCSARRDSLSHWRVLIFWISTWVFDQRALCGHLGLGSRFGAIAQIPI